MQLKIQAWQGQWGALTSTCTAVLRTTTQTRSAVKWKRADNGRNGINVLLRDYRGQVGMRHGMNPTLRGQAGGLDQSRGGQVGGLDMG